MLLSREGISVLIWMVVFTILTTLVIAFRFWAVKIKDRPLRADDYMVVVAYVSVANCL